MKLTTVLLDFGGTLDGPGVHWSTQFARAFAAAGLCADRPELDRAFLASEATLTREPPPRDWDLAAYVGHQASLMAAELAASPGLAARAAELFLAEAGRHLARAAETLRDHASTFRFGLISNFPETLVSIVEHAGLRGCFGALGISDVEGVRKPDPRLFARVLDRLGATPGEAAMVGDSLRNDIQGAKAAGLAQAVWLKGDEILGGGDPSAADATVGSLDEALAWLGRLA